MNHQRQLIREAVVALLAAAGTSAGARVYDHPYDPRVTFPALTVEDATEQQQSDSMPAGAQRPIERRYLFAVTAEVQQIAGYARARDQLVAAVEAAIATASLPGVKAVTPAGYQPASSDAGERPIAIGRQLFEALYYTSQGAPDTPL